MTTVILTEDLMEMEAAAAAAKQEAEACKKAAERATAEAEWQMLRRELEAKTIREQLAIEQNGREKAEKALKKARDRANRERSRAAILVFSMVSAAMVFGGLVCVNWVYLWAVIGFLLGAWGVASLGGLTFRKERDK